MDHKINRSQQCDIAVQKAKAVLGCGLTTAGIFLPSFGTNAKKNANKMQSRVDANGSGNHIIGRDG